MVNATDLRTVPIRRPASVVDQIGKDSPAVRDIRSVPSGAPEGLSRAGRGPAPASPGSRRVPYRKEDGMGYLVTIMPAMLLGFLAGLLSFKVKSRWCSNCGTVKSCPRCARWAGSVVPQGLSASTTDGKPSQWTGGGLYPEARHVSPGFDPHATSGRPT